MQYFRNAWGVRKTFFHHCKPLQRKDHKSRTVSMLHMWYCCRCLYSLQWVTSVSNHYHLIEQGWIYKVMHRSLFETDKLATSLKSKKKKKEKNWSVISVWTHNGIVDIWHKTLHYITLLCFCHSSTLNTGSPDWEHVMHVMYSLWVSCTSPLQKPEPSV